MIGKIFYSRLIGKFFFQKTISLTFYFYRQVVKKSNSRLSIWVILDLWSIKVKKFDNIVLKSHLLQLKSTDSFLISP